MPFLKAGQLSHSTDIDKTYSSSSQPHDCANKFDIKVYEKIQIRPVIKCKYLADGSKVFYLPFDKEYFDIRINIQAGDMYVYDVTSAISADFTYAQIQHTLNTADRRR